MGPNEKVIHTNEWFEVIDRGGKFGVRPDTDSVIIIPYINDEQGLPLMIGVLKEVNAFREGGSSLSLITGRPDDEDPNLIETAKRELKEESGYDVQDNERWFFLGTVTGSKFVESEHPCFAVNLTEIKQGERTTDGSQEEVDSKFYFISSNDVVKTKDVFIPALFLKLFKYVVGMDLYQRDDSIFGKPKGFTVEI